MTRYLIVAPVQLTERAGFDLVLHAQGRVR